MNEIARHCAESGGYVLSEGTMRLQDTIPRMLEALQVLHGPSYEQACFGSHALAPSHATEDERAEWWGSEEAEEAFQALFDALNEHAPEGFYFGANEGDGACLGFWAFEPDEVPEEQEHTCPTCGNVCIATLGRLPGDWTFYQGKACCNATCGEAYLAR